MRLPPAHLWLFAVVSALLQLVCFPISGPVPEWRTACCWIALVSLLQALLWENRASKTLNIQQGAVLGYGCGFLWYMGNCAWIYQTMYLYGGLPKPVAFAVLCLFSLYLALYHALFAVFIVLIRRSSFGARGALLVAPFAWVTVELARTRITGFPWDLLGNTQTNNLLLTTIAPLTGVMGISFLVVCINSGLALSLQSPKRSYLAWSLLILAGAMQLGGDIFWRKHANLPAGQTAVLLQENLEVGVAARETRPFTREEEYQIFSGWTLHPLTYRPDVGWVPVKPGFSASILVWPEAPSHLESNDPAFRATIGSLAFKASAPVVAGSLGIDFSSLPERGYFLYDSAALFDKAGEYRGRYDKIHLVPWGEYVPFKRFFSFAQKLTEGVGDMDRGHERTVFRTGGHTYGIFVCYESIFGDEVRQFVRNGAEVLVNISDDGWYGDSGAPWQHLNMVRMRAIENRRWVLRSTNTGITTAIDPEGRIAFEAPRHVRAAFAFPFGFTQGETFYTKYGDWFAYLCAFVTVGAVLLSWTRKMN